MTTSPAWATLVWLRPQPQESVLPLTGRSVCLSVWEAESPGPCFQSDLLLNSLVYTERPQCTSEVGNKQNGVLPIAEEGRP